VDSDEKPSVSGNSLTHRVTRRGQPRHQVVDPAVSRAKFEREVDVLRRHEPEYRHQGWFLIQAEFPEVFLVLTAPQLRPSPVLFGVVIDFVNYDADPPSVQVVSPWTREPLRARELLSPLPKLAQPPAPPAGEGESAGLSADCAEAPVHDSSQLAAAPVPAQLELQNLMQWWTLDSIPFLCMRGVREYHRHPAHNGDAWLLHRRRGEGSLAAILSAIHERGSAPIKDYFYEVTVQKVGAQHNGLVQQLTARLRGFVNAWPQGFIIYSWPL
jgi:hypothetical protein